MRFATSLCFGVVVAALLAAPARSQDIDDLLKVYGVHVDRTPRQSWTGLGIYLGQGIVLTPAHVSGLGFWRTPRVDIAGKLYPTRVLKDGHFHRVDLTLLFVDVNELPVSLGLRRLPLCPGPSWPNEQVVLVTQENAVRSFVVPPARLPGGIRSAYRTAVGLAPETGGSGSAVIDANKRCLVGMITRTIEVGEMTRGGGAQDREAGRCRQIFHTGIGDREFLAGGPSLLVARVRGRQLGGAGVLPVPGQRRRQSLVERDAWRVAEPGEFGNVGAAALRAAGWRRAGDNLDLARGERGDTLRKVCNGDFFRGADMIDAEVFALLAHEHDAGDQIVDEAEAARLPAGALNVEAQLSRRLLCQVRSGVAPVGE